MWAAVAGFRRPHHRRQEPHHFVRRPGNTNTSGHPARRARTTHLPDRPFAPCPPTRAHGARGLPRPGPGFLPKRPAAGRVRSRCIVKSDGGARARPMRPCLHACRQPAAGQLRTLAALRSRMARRSGSGDAGVSRSPSRPAASSRSHRERLPPSGRRYPSVDASTVGGLGLFHPGHDPLES